MATNFAQIKVTGVNQMVEALKANDQQVKRRIAFEFLNAKPAAESWAKRFAPWTDQSGNARSGLHADVRSIDNGNAFELIMAHSVFYGIFLETRFSGKYAILMPTVNHIGAQLLQKIEKAIGGAVI